MNFGGFTEEVMTRDEFSLEKAREVLKNETIAVLGYGVQGPGQAQNLRDNGFNVIVGQRQGKTYDKALPRSVPLLMHHSKRLLQLFRTTRPSLSSPTSSTPRE